MDCNLINVALTAAATESSHTPGYQNLCHYQSLYAFAYLSFGRQPSDVAITAIPEHAGEWTQGADNELLAAAWLSIICASHERLAANR